jgi:stage V sporulation protein R
MGQYNTDLTPELADIAGNLLNESQKVGLDCFPTVFEMVDYKQMNEIAAYGGFPTRYPHWRWGMDYERLSKSYEYGLSLIYEMVINNNPCYAYLLRANSMVHQKTVIAHVYGHCDFFKNNYWFTKTNRKMLNQMANHSTYVRSIINEIGHNEVEDFIDVCLSLDNLIDITSPFKSKTKSTLVDDTESYKRAPLPKIKSKKYMDSYINPNEFMDYQQRKKDAEIARVKNFPEEPERDVLKFLMEQAPIPGWQKKIIQIIREEAYYFAPQGQTKILNEGWATYWHSKMMTEIVPLHPSEIIDYAESYAGIVASNNNSLNPYKLGLELLRHVERRWDRGQFGLEYVNCTDPKVRAEWNTKAGLGRQKLFEIRKFHNDITFLDEFLDEDFCHATNMFIYDFDKRANKYVISSRNFKEIKSRLLQQLTNFGQPIIRIVDGNFKNRNELLLEHVHDGEDLKNETTMETLKNIHKIWHRPVHIETTLEDVKRRISFDGSNHQIEKL